MKIRRTWGALFLPFIGAFAAQAATQPWDQPFSGPPTEMAKAAASVKKPDAGIVVLLDDHRLVIQKDGTCISTDRRVYRVLSTEDLDDWAMIEKDWEPWHENKPRLRARVISPDGIEHWLDEKTIAESAVAQFDNTIFSDEKLLRAPLPAVTVGSVIEYEVIKQDTAPLFSAGIARTFTPETGVPTERFHISIDSAPGVNLLTAGTLIPASAVTRAENHGATHIEVELGPAEALKDIEFSLPPDQPLYPQFRLSTGASWQSIAAAYSQIVQRQLASADLQDLLPAAKAQSNPRALAEKLTLLVHKNVRYTGVEFGEAAIVPASPGEVLKRHYGDCKDKSLLLAALLRAAGLKAHLALLSVNSALEIDPNLPGFGHFNHAIVYVESAEPIWIDATAETAPAGSLPLADQNRLALVIDPATTALVRTPQSTASANRIVHRIEVRLPPTGKGDIHESLEAFGAFDIESRARFGGTRPEVEKQAEFLAKNAFRGESAQNVQVTPKDDFSRPFQLVLDVKNSAAAVASLADAAVSVSNSFLFEYLPWNLGPQEGQKPRVHDFIVNRPYRAEVHVKVFPPRDFNLRELPDPQKWSDSSARYSMQANKTQDGAIQLDYSFELTATRLTPAQVETLRTNLKKCSNGNILAFDSKGHELFAIGKTAQALQAARKAVQDQPQDPVAQMRLSQILWQVGAGDAAVGAARRAVELDPKSSQSWLTLAYALEHDSFGRLRTGNWNFLEAEKALRKALEIDPSSSEAQLELAILLEYDSTGNHYSSNARLEESAKIYRQILEKSPNLALRRNLAFLLMNLGKFSEAKEEIQQAPQDLSLASMRVAITALSEGADRAVLVSQSVLPNSDGATAAVLEQAARFCFQLREYPAGADLMRAAQRLDQNPQLVQLLASFSGVKRYETLTAPDSDPTSPVRQFFLLAAAGSNDRQALAAILSQHADLDLWLKRVDLVHLSLAVSRVGFEDSGAKKDLIADMISSRLKFSTEPGEKQNTPQIIQVQPAVAGKPAVVVQRIPRAEPSQPAILVTVRIEHAAPAIFTFFIVLEDGKAKILACGQGLESIGKLALAALGKGDLAAARAWLDEAGKNALPTRANDDKGPAIRYLWAGVAPETRTAVFIRAAAASLLSTYSGSLEAIAVLRKIAEHPPAYLDRADLQFAICEGLENTGRWTDLQTAAEPLFKSRAYGDAAFRFAGESLIGLQDWNALAKMAATRLAASPKDHAALQFAAISALLRHDSNAAADFLARSKTALYAGYLEDDLLEDWNAILSGSPAPGSIAELEKQNVLLLSVRDIVYTYTLALAQVRSGKLEESHRTLLAALSAGPVTPSGFAWLVQAEILKRCDLDPNPAFQNAKSAGGFSHLPFAAALIP